MMRVGCVAKQRYYNLVNVFRLHVIRTGSFNYHIYSAYSNANPAIIAYNYYIVATAPL